MRGTDIHTRAVIWTPACSDQKRFLLITEQPSDCTGIIEAQWHRHRLLLYHSRCRVCVCVCKWNINRVEAALSLYKPKGHLIPLQLFYFGICGAFVHLPLWLGSLLPSLLPALLNYSGGELLYIHLSASQGTPDFQYISDSVLCAFG